MCSHNAALKKNQYCFPAAKFGTRIEIHLQKFYIIVLMNSAKSVTLAILLASFALSVDAQSLLRVKLADGERINVSVNGRYFDRRGNSITVGDLPPGRHFVKVFAVTPGRWGRSYQSVVYQGRITTYNNTLTTVVYDPYTRMASITERRLNDNGAYAESADRAQYNNDDSRYVEKTYTQKRFKAEEDENATKNEKSSTNQPAASPINDHSLSDAEMYALKDKLNQKKTDTDKQKLLRDALKKRSVTTFQVGTMMDWLLFESTKLEFAKWAYNITTDRVAYSDLLKKFSYQSSKDEINDLLKNNH